MLYNFLIAAQTIPPTAEQIAIGQANDAQIALLDAEIELERARANRDMFQERVLRLAKLNDSVAKIRQVR